MPDDAIKYPIHRFRELEFTALTALNKKRVDVQFKGKFKNKKIVWNASIFTLDSLLQDKGMQHEEQRQAITIEAAEDNHYKIIIELDVKLITESTVFKTMLMIHNYKKLKVGRHEFGRAHFRTSDS